MGVFALTGGLGVLWPVLSARAAVVAQVGDRKWLRSEMDRDLRNQVWPWKRQMLDLENDWVWKKIDAELMMQEAKKRGLTLEEMAAQVDQNRPQSIERLRADYRAKSFLPVAPAGPVAFRYDPAQAIGPEGATVELVIFSDFTCKYCIEMDSLLRRIRNEYPQIRIIHRDFPLTADGPGFVAAIAGKCAAEQGKFWEFHDRLFDEKGDLPLDKLMGIARQLHLEENRFAQDLRSPEVRNAVQASYDDAIKLGVVGAPTMYLNGVKIDAVMDYVSLRGKIASELQAVGDRLHH